jgi:hypothetical protein
MEVGLQTRVQSPNIARELIVARWNTNTPKLSQPSNFDFNFNFNFRFVPSIIVTPIDVDGAAET